MVRGKNSFIVLRKYYINERMNQQRTNERTNENCNSENWFYLIFIGKKKRNVTQHNMFYFVSVHISRQISYTKRFRLNVGKKIKKC